MNKKNLANAQLLNSISAGATSITVKMNQGEALPVTPFFATLSPLGVLSTIDNSEIVQVTARAGDVLTVIRAQRGTTAKEFQAESILANSVYIEDTIPAGGTNGQFLKRDASGNAVWGADNNTTYTEITEAEIAVGTASTARAISGRRWTYMFDSVKAWVNTAISTAVSQNVYPVGSLYFNADNPANPGTLLGIGTWEAYAEGRVPVGKAPSGTFSTAGATTGQENTVLVNSNLPSYTAGVSMHSAGAGTNVHSITSGAGLVSLNQNNAYRDGGNGPTGGAVSQGGFRLNIGQASPTPVTAIQPSVVVYIWRRVS